MNEELTHLARTLRSALLGEPMQRDDMVMPWNGWLGLSALRYQIGRGNAPIDPYEFAVHVERRRRESAVEARLWRWTPTAPLLAWCIRHVCEPAIGDAPALLIGPLAALVTAAQRADPDRKPRLLDRCSRCFSDIELCAPTELEAERIITKYFRK